MVRNYFAGSSYCVLDLQSEEEVRCCLSGAKLVLMKNGVMVVLSVKLCTFCGVCMCIPMEMRIFE